MLAELQDLQNRLAALDIVVKLVPFPCTLLSCCSDTRNVSRAQHACRHALGIPHGTGIWACMCPNFAVLTPLKLFS